MEWIDKYAFFMDLFGNDEISKTLANYSKWNNENQCFVCGNETVLKALEGIIRLVYESKGIILDGFKKGKWQTCWKKLIKYGIDENIAKIACASKFIT